MLPATAGYQAIPHKQRPYHIRFHQLQKMVRKLIFLSQSEIFFLIVLVMDKDQAKNLGHLQQNRHNL